MNERRKKIILLVVIITVLLVTFQLNCMLCNSLVATYYQRKKKLLQMFALATQNRSHFQKERNPREYWVAPGRT